MTNYKSNNRDKINPEYYLKVHKKLIKYLGLIEANILSDLVQKESYFENKKEMTQDGFFFNTAESIERSIFVKEKQQRRCIKSLETAGVITTEIRGVPPKKYFKIEHEKIHWIFENTDLDIYISKTDETTVSKPPDSPYQNGRNSRIYNKDIDNKDIDNKDIDNKNSYKNKNIVVSKKKPQDSSLFNSFIPIEKNILSLLVKTLPIAFRNRLPAAGVKPTALLYQTESLILAIREGRFFRDVTISEQKQEDWVVGIRIVRSLKGSSWEDIGKVLKRAAKRYQMMLSPKYGFPNKKGMTRDINIFLYNPNSQHSWFLKCLSHKPKQNSQYIDDHNIKQFQSDIPAEALSALTKFKRNNWDEGGYWKKSRDLYEWYDDERKRLKEANPNWSSYCGRFERFLKYYDEFTESWDIFTLGHFGAENKTWDRFVEWLNTEYGVNLNPRRQRTQSVSTAPRKAMKEKTEREVIAERLVSEGICDDIDEAMPFADIEVIRKESENGENRTYAGI